MSLSGEELYDLWAPPQSGWSVWAKPVLFADIDHSADTSLAIDVPVVRNLPPSGTAIIVDIPGSDSVLYGLALARAGFQPVPLYNGGSGPNSLVDMRTIANFLGYGAPVLKSLTLPPGAPPVFLLNADRLNNAGGSKPGRYDNRWCVIPQDMPSAGYLLEAEIARVVLIADRIMSDLSHVLCRYQDAGIAILQASELQAVPRPVTVAKPARYKSLWYRFQAFAGLRRNSVGGFGAIVPDPNDSGGFYGGYIG